MAEALAPTRCAGRPPARSADDAAGRLRCGPRRRRDADENLGAIEQLAGQIERGQVGVRQRTAGSGDRIDNPRARGQREDTCMRHLPDDVDDDGRAWRCSTTRPNSAAGVGHAAGADGNGDDAAARDVASTADVESRAACGAACTKYQPPPPAPSAATTARTATPRRPGSKA